MTETKWREIHLPGNVVEDILSSGDGVISDKMTDHSGWAVRHTLTFKYEGKIYEAYYACQAAEYQEELEPWARAGEVRCVEVRAVKAERTEYERVLASGTVGERV